jgi:hypothetical protein
MKPTVAVITPTYKRSLDIVERCIRTVQWQNYGIDNIVHFIGHDGPSEEPLLIPTLIKKYNWKNIEYYELPTNTNTYGAGVRQFFLEKEVIPRGIKYVTHVDDDNVIYPEFIKTHVDCLEQSDKDFSICKILHLGPVPAKFGRPPVVLDGVPPVFCNIDTLQIMAKSDAMYKCGWIQKTGREGYCNDGYTYEKLGKEASWIDIPKILGVHI